MREIDHALNIIHSALSDCRHDSGKCMIHDYVRKIEQASRSLRYELLESRLLNDEAIRIHLMLIETCCELACCNLKDRNDLSQKDCLMDSFTKIHTHIKELNLTDKEESTI